MVYVYESLSGEVVKTNENRGPWFKDQGITYYRTIQLETYQL